MIPRAVVELISKVSDSELRVLMVLLGLSDGAVSIEHLALTAGLSTDRTLDAVKSLADRNVIERPTPGKLNIPPRLTDGPTRTLKFGWKTEVQEDVETELLALREHVARLEAGDTSGLANLLGNQEAAIVFEVEEILGRALEVPEAWYLGQMLQGFGPDRVRNALQKKKSSKNVVKGIYAMLKNGASGKPAQAKTEIPNNNPWRPPDDFDPFAVGRS